MRPYTLSRTDKDGFIAIKFNGVTRFYVKRWEERREDSKVRLKDHAFVQAPGVWWVTLFQIHTLDRQPVGEPGDRVVKMVDDYIKNNP